MRLHLSVVRLWHALLLGGFVVAYLSGDEDTYSMHLFAGWLVVGLVALRLMLALAAPDRSPLRLKRAGRPRYFAVSILAALALAGVAAVSGVAADLVPWLEDPHEVLAEMSLWVALGHVAAAVVLFKGRWLLARLNLRAATLVCLVALMAAAQPVWATDARRDAILAAYAAQARAADAGFAGFSATRGEALYRSRNAVNPDAASCASCHTDDPTRSGRHVKTGRTIEPVAVSANPKRFTDAEKVEERFTRDCKSILGRPCTAIEKGDYLTYLASR